MGDQYRIYRYIHLKEISFRFIKTSPTLRPTVLELVLEDDAGDKLESNKFMKYQPLDWNLDTYVRIHTIATLTIRQVHPTTNFAEVSVVFKPNKFRDDKVVRLKDSRHRFTIHFVCGRSQSLADVTRFLDSQTRTDLASTVPRFLKHPQLAVLPPPTSDDSYVSIHWLNDDILLGVFNCYRLDEDKGSNYRLGWCKLSHVCQRWRHLIYDSAFHLGIHIECTNGSPVVGTLDHLPPLPLCVDYRASDYFGDTILTEQDESGIYHALRFHDRVHRIHLKIPPSILHKVLVLMDEHFPKLEHLSLSSTDKKSTLLTLSKAFLAPHLRHLAFPGVSPPKRLRFLTSTVSLVILELGKIQTANYFRPRVLVARLRSLPHLEELSIEFSIPIPRPSAEREMLGEQRAPVTLPSLKKLQFKGVSAYLESLIAQIRVPLLGQLVITLFNQVAFVLPHLFHLINITGVFKLPAARVSFYYDEVTVTVDHHIFRSKIDRGPFLLRVKCKQLDWKIDCAAQICNALIPTLPGVEQIALHYDYYEIPTELENGAIDSTMWHDLLRPFIGLKGLRISYRLLEELSRALQVDEVGLDPGFLPNLRSIHAVENQFTSFIDARQAVGRPVKFL